MAYFFQTLLYLSEYSSFSLLFRSRRIIRFQDFKNQNSSMEMIKKSSSNFLKAFLRVRKHHFRLLMQS